MYGITLAGGQMKKRQTVNLDSLKRDVVRFEELVHICPNGIALCDDDKIVDANSALAKMLGRTTSEFIGQDIASLIIPDERESTQRKLSVLLHEDLGHATSCRTQLVRADHSAIHVEISICSLEQAAANNAVVIRPLAVFRNSPALSSEELLQRSHMLRMGVFGELAASLIHALGQPVTAATGARDLLLDAKGRPHIDAGNSRAADILMASVNDFAGKFKTIWDFVRVRKPNQVEVGVNSICEDAIDMVSQFAAHSGVTIEFSAGDRLTATADPSLLHLTLVSLLHRSVLSLTTTTESNRRILVTTAIADDANVSIDINHNGIGLSREESGADSNSACETPIDNLTVATCRLIVEQNGGVLSIKPSALGTRYRLTLPN